MVGLIQRVMRAAVSVDGRTVARIDSGLLVFIGVGQQDSADDADRLLRRILGLRLFPDRFDRMNLSLADAGGGLLLVPNFTLMADTRKGMRPSFARAAGPELARPLFERMVGMAREKVSSFGAGIFGADMQVELVNDGPVTVRLSTAD